MNRQQHMVRSLNMKWMTYFADFDAAIAFWASYSVKNWKLHKRANRSGLKSRWYFFGFLNDLDITALFANLWDNAIEACAKLAPDRRHILFVMQKVNGFLVINMENPFDSVVPRANKNSALQRKIIWALDYPFCVPPLKSMMVCWWPNKTTLFFWLK